MWCLELKTKETRSRYGPFATYPRGRMPKIQKYGGDMKWRMMESFAAKVHYEYGTRFDPILEEKGG